MQDKLEDQRQDMEEKQNFFIQAGKMEDDDELLDELNELEALAAEEELAKEEIGSGHIISTNHNMGTAIGAPTKAPAKSDEEELRQLEAMMI